MSETKRRNRAGDSQTSLGVNMNDEFELGDVRKTRPSSSHSRNAWSEADMNGPGSDDVDFSPRAPASATAVDVPSAMEAEPVAHARHITADVRAPGTKNVPVGCGTRFKRIIRSKFVSHNAKTNCQTIVSLSTSFRA